MDELGGILRQSSADLTAEAERAAAAVRARSQDVSAELKRELAEFFEVSDAAANQARAKIDEIGEFLKPAHRGGRRPGG